MQAHTIKRRPGGQPGNQNALKHGQCTYRAISARKAATARVKAASVILHGLGAIPGRCRRRLVRPDQVPLLPLAWQAWFSEAALTAPANFLDQKLPRQLVVKG